MNVITWTPIGDIDDYTGSHRFYGNYDGNCKRIFNLTYDGSGVGGLFGYVGNSSGSTTNTLKNIRLVNCSITSTNGNAAGIVVSAAKCNIENCEVRGTIDAHSYYAGGIVANISDGSITGCFASGSVQARSKTGSSYLHGMIAGHISSTTTGSYNTYISSNGVGAGNELAADFATEQLTSGTTADGLSWSLGGTYHTELTISGSGAMQNYGTTTVLGLWRTTAPWGWHLTEVTVDNGVTSIGNYAFVGDQSLALIYLGSDVTTIGQGAFDRCDAAREITLSASVTTIAYGAFANCKGLEKFNINYDGAVTLGNSNVFEGCDALQYIIFSTPAGVLANTTGNWSGYSSKIRTQFGTQLFSVTNEGGTPAYKIATEQDLRNLSTAVNAGNDGSGLTFRQTNDINLASGDNFTPIGYKTNQTGFFFSGTYDGGGFTLTGLTVSGDLRQALFGFVQDATIKNLTISGASITATNVYSGVFVGHSQNALTMVNCHAVNCTVNGNGSVGLLVGYMQGLGSYSYLKGCTATGGSVSCSDPNGTSVGALVGKAFNNYSNRMKMVGCVGRGVTGGSVLVGYNTNNAIQIIHSYDGNAYTITAGTGVTITYGAVSSEYPDVTQPPYIASGETVSLTLSHTSGSGAEFTATNALLNDTFTELSNATGNVTISATARTDISGGTVADIPTQTWTVSPATPAVTVTVGGQVLTEGTDYFVTYTNNSDIGINTATATVTGKGSYKGTLSKNFSIALSGVPYNATDGCYEIATETALRNLATYVNAGNDGSGKTFKQTQPITLTGGNFPMIGSGRFNGTYDGGGLAISGLTVSIAGNKVGLFGYVDGGTVRNVILISPSVTSTINTSLDITVGALVGCCYAATIENCHVLSPSVSFNGNTSGAKRLGALIGEIRVGSVTNSHFYSGNQSNAIGYIGNNATVTRVGQINKLTLPTGVTATGTPVLTYAGEGYYTSGSSVTLSDLPTAAGWIYTYTVTKTADGTDITATALSSTTLTMPDYDVSVTLQPAVILADNADNTAAIAKCNGMTLPVTLQGRKLYKDGAWNTLCLPFDLVLEGSPLAGADARPLSAASISGSTLYLTFGDAVTTLSAGVPYIIKWTKDDVNPTIDDPVFSGVTINATDNSYDNQMSSDERVRFVGTYKSTTFEATDYSILFMGGNNKLYYPTTGAGIGAQRAYFKIGDGTALARQLTSFNINFGEDEQTGIGLINGLTPDPSLLRRGEIYNLNGQRMNKPQKGINIVNGKKVLY